MIAHALYTSEHVQMYTRECGCGHACARACPHAFVHTHMLDFDKRPRGLSDKGGDDGAGAVKESVPVMRLGLHADALPGIVTLEHVRVAEGDRVVRRQIHEKASFHAVKEGDHPPVLQELSMPGGCYALRPYRRPPCRRPLPVDLCACSPTRRPIRMHAHTHTHTFIHMYR